MVVLIMRMTTLGLSSIVQIKRLCLSVNTTPQLVYDIIIIPFAYHGSGQIQNA